MSIIINVEQSPLTISPSNAEHIYTLSSTGHTLPEFKYLVDVYFKPQGLNEELASRLKVAPNTYGRAIMDVGEIIRTFLNANPRFTGQTYPFLNLVADENSVITLANAEKAREYNGYNLTPLGNRNPNLNQLWHVAQYRCVVGCEYTSGNTIVTDVNPNASYQPDYVTIFPGVDNSLVPEPFLPYGSLGSGYTGSANFYQVDNQGWYYYNLFRHVYQKPGVKECRNYTYNNLTSSPVQIKYTTCDNEEVLINVSASTEYNFCALEGSVVIGASGCTCNSYAISNEFSFVEKTVYWTDCSGNSQSQIILPGAGIQICACAGSVYSDVDITITNLGPCTPACICLGYSITNDAIIGDMTVNWNDCDGNPQTTILEPGIGFSTCACEGSITTDGGAPNIVISGPCGECLCRSYEVTNDQSFMSIQVDWIDCDGSNQFQILAPDEAISLCACQGTVTSLSLITVVDIGACGECVCKSYEVTNDLSFFPVTINWISCEGISQTQILAPDEGISLCACEGTIDSAALVTIVDIGTCGEPICTCNGYSITNIALFGDMNVNWIDCDGLSQTNILQPGIGFSTCACIGTVGTSGGVPEVIDIGPCGECICNSYQIINPELFSGTVFWNDCGGNPQSRIIIGGGSIEICACVGSISSDIDVDIIDLGLCGDSTLTDNGLCNGYNPVKECPGPQEFMNAAGKTECAVVQSNGQSFTNVRRRMHHPDCPMIVSFLNGKNDYFTNDIYSIAVRGALNHGDPYTYSAECENRVTTTLPTTEEPPNSTFKMLNFYLPYNVTLGNTLNAIPTNSQKVCFYGTTYNSNRNNRLDMASATTEILEYWIQPQDCINEPIHILFMNGRGMWDTYTFGKKNTKKITLERKKYQQETSLDKQLYARGSSDRGQKIFEQNASYSWDCNTWFMDEADTTIMQEMFMSQDVFIITGTTIPNQYCQSDLGEIRLYQYLIPVVIKETDFVVYQKQYQKIYQYNLTLEFGSVKRFRTQG
jgi:hypothetical protein